MSERQQKYREIIADFVSRPLDHVLARDLILPENVPKVVSLSGPRRSGKTWMLLDTIRRLRAYTPADRLICFNFEDDRLFPLRIEDLDDILKAYYELYPHNRGKTIWFFFDEVQEVENWEKFVRRLYDQGDFRIYITGSSSRLLSGEMASAMRGRTLPFQALPLSFAEYLRFMNLQTETDTSAGQSAVLHALRQYFTQGGFPELAFVPNDIHRRIMHEYIDLTLYRDLAERFSIRNTALLKYLFKFLVSNLGNLFSVNRVFNDLKSLGYPIGRNTIYEYVSHLEEAYAVFRVQLWSHSVRRQAINPDKIYIVDPAVKHAMTVTEDFGRVFENVVYLELRRREKEIHYFHESGEVDFVVDGQELINACSDFSELETRRRELKGMEEAMIKLNQKSGLILSWNSSEMIKTPQGTIQVLPLWKWLLGSQ